MFHSECIKVHIKTHKYISILTVASSEGPARAHGVSPDVVVSGSIPRVSLVRMKHSALRRARVYVCVCQAGC